MDSNISKYSNLIKRRLFKGSNSLKKQKENHTKTNAFQGEKNTGNLLKQYKQNVAWVNLQEFSHIFLHIS